MAEGFIAVHKLKNALWRCAVCVGVVCVGVQRAQFKRRFLLIAAISLALVGLSACAPLVPKASPLNIDYTRIPDPAEPPTEAEMDALEAQAKNGDWNLKVFFADVYFEEKLEDPQYWQRKTCAQRFTYGHVCRAAAARTETAESFLREVLDHPDSEFWFWRVRFAEKRLRDAYPNPPYRVPWPERSNDMACKEAVHYLERAVEGALALKMKPCDTTERLSNMAWEGRCMPLNRERSAHYSQMTKGCSVIFFKIP